MTSPGEHRRRPPWLPAARFVCSGVLVMLAFLTVAMFGWLAGLLLLSACAMTALSGVIDS
jgi:hypothetical protein